MSLIGIVGAYPTKRINMHRDKLKSSMNLNWTAAMGLQFTKNKDKTPGEKRREVVRGTVKWGCKGKMFNT